MLADRNVVESEADTIYASAKEEDVAFLVVGDPLCATTHTDLIIRARELGIKVTRNLSIMYSDWWQPSLRRIPIDWAYLAYLILNAARQCVVFRWK